MRKVPSLRIVPPDEHHEWCKKQIKEKGLYNAVKEQLDEIILDCKQLGYSEHGDVTAKAQDILDLIETFGEKYGIYRVDRV